MSTTTEVDDFSSPAPGIAQPAGPATGKKTLWAGRILSGLVSLMFLFSAGMKFAAPPSMAEGLAHLGLPMSMVFGLGLLELVITIIYIIPQTAVLGAILLTGYLGGAILTHLRVGDPYFMPIILGVVVWAGIFLRDARLRTLIPFRRL